ncbi:MAG TPA: ABC transporter permease [Nitrospirae bacterium]|nr:ABC transporter permease [Nitrospirota bacterium]
MSSVTIDTSYSASQYWRDFISFRELIFFLVWRDIVTRYKQSFLGISWSVFRPVLTVGMMTIIFGYLAKFPAGDVPYPALVLAGLMPWQFFTSSLQSSTTSVTGATALVQRVYFPRLILPFASIMVNLVDFLITSVIMAGILIWYKFIPDWRLFTIPFFMLLAVGASLGIGLWLSVFNVRFRDIKDIVPIITQIGTYVSPVGYSVSVVPEKYQLLYSLNPMVGIIDGFRWAILGGEHHIFMPALIVSVVFTLATFSSGVWFFTRAERTFPDVI